MIRSVLKAGAAAAAVGAGLLLLNLAGGMGMGDVKLAVAALKARDKRQAEAFRRDHRPWGWFETLVLADRFQVKRIVVHPGAALSLQSHVHRAEHWIVVRGYNARARTFLIVDNGHPVEWSYEHFESMFDYGQDAHFELALAAVNVQKGSIIYRR